MTLRFYVRFASAWGQQLVLCLENGQRLAMDYVDPQTWAFTLEWEDAVIQYRYAIQSEGSLEENTMRGVHFPQNVSAYAIHDTFHFPGDIAASWMRAPFRDVFYTREGMAAANPGTTGSHRFRVRAPLLPVEKKVWLIGNVEPLGNWAPDFAVEMFADGNGIFSVEVELPVQEAIAYKYCVSGSEDDWEWEQGENRTYYSESAASIDDGFARFPRQPWKGAGVAVPVFSLRSGKSLGCGEFADLPLLAEWAAAAGIRMIQLLPVNDTTWSKTWQDSYPYAAVSAFALHPIYIHLPSIGQVRGYAEQQKRLDLPEMDYEATLAFKETALRGFYRAFTPDAAFLDWERAQAHWLPAYANFCCRRDGTSDQGYYRFVQYHLHKQLTTAVAILRSKGIALKGDLPIGMFLHSADVLEQPGLFNTAVQAGAPPDEFATEGQNWGFPAYNWEQMEADGFNWWKRRLQHMAQYFSAFRIDHVLGFFRLWQVPRNAASPLLGYFQPSIPLTASEITDVGIPFSRERYCRPYITDGVISSLFGHEADRLKSAYLEPQSPGFYRLKQAQPFAGEKPSFAAALRQLAANVLFLEPEPDQFHPRFGMADTLSFQALPDLEQTSLRRLADDFFFHRHDELWKRSALHKLPVLTSATDMLVCGEDLGLIPHSVPEVMSALGILGLEVDRMPRYPGRTPADAPYLSVVTPSTHDMSTLRSEVPTDREPSIRRQLLSPAMWCILQLQDWLSLDDSLPHPDDPSQERINVPAILPWYWRYRMPLPLESLLEATSLRDRVHRLISEAGREG
ncbi:4-alpha-glucanotransferase [Chitinophaga caseinilytica]|uniref:4-alpha-glucanotransferase n=1 Tax=Chitinophaga caseinilytica TaxID=2267521 RepID=A0ABZ2ZAU6_9BACT